MKVLHSVSEYLKITENWIQPQVNGVAGVTGAVLCGIRTNADAFPMARGLLFEDPARGPAWHWRLQPAADWMLQNWGVNHFHVRREIGRWRPDLIHAHFGMRGWESLNLARSLRVPLLTSFYGFDAWMAPRVEPVWKSRFGELFAQGSLFLVEGPAMQERLVTLGCPADKVVIQRLGIDMTTSPFARRSFTGQVRIVMIGRFVEKKGLADGLRACAAARAAGVDLSVTIVGGPGSTSEGRDIESQLELLARSKELAGTVRFTGFLTPAETSAELDAHDVFLCPSRHAASGDAEGGSPVTLTEAMARGLWCVGTRHCDIPELIVDGTTGRLSAEGDVDGLAEHLVTHFKDPSTAIAHTQAGRLHVENYFCLERQLDSLGRLYSDARATGGRVVPPSSSAAVSAASF